MKIEYTGIEPYYAYGSITERPKYKFTALCTSDTCRTRKSGTNFTDVGVVKNVSKTTDTCPDCKEYLFWEKTPA